MRVRLDSRWRMILLIVGVVVLLLVVGGLIWFVQPNLAATPPQPAPMNHRAMVGVGIPCLYCHASAAKSTSAGIPSVALCYGCHRQIATNRPTIQEVLGYWERQEPILWTRVYRMPRFVFFSHQPHVAAGVDCANCHGNVAQMTVAQRVTNMNMGWCLDCHNDQARAAELRDCTVCHR